MQQATSNMINLPIESLSTLGEEIAKIADSLSRVGKKLQQISSIPTVEVKRETDPEMFTKEFRQTVRKSLNDIKNGRIIPYEQVRQELGL